MKLPHHFIPDESAKSLGSLVLGVWLMVWLYASIHNQYVIRLEPEHFTVWHYGIPFIRNHTLLGIAYAFGASVTPGIILGICLFLAGRMFGRRKLGIRRIVMSTFWVWVAVEICSVAAGMTVWKSGKGIYPGWVYPDDSRGMLTTQTIQVTAYLSGAVFSLFLLFILWHLRGRKNGIADSEQGL